MALIKTPTTFYDQIDSGEEFPVLDIRSLRSPTLAEGSPTHTLVHSVNSWIERNKIMITDVVFSSKFYEELINRYGFICGIRTLAGDAVITVNPNQDISIMCFGDSYGL